MDYASYTLNRNEKICWYAASCAALFAAGMLFYRSILLSLALCAASVPFKKHYEDWLAARRRRRFLEGFKSMLYSISASVSAGHQLPGALELAERQLRAELGEDADICAELKGMLEAYAYSPEPLTDSMSELARRSGQDAVKQFAAAISVCSRSGGDLESVALKTSSALLDMLGFEDELRAMFAEKRFDMLVIGSMPVIMLAVLNVSSAGYIEPLYTTMLGRLIMTLALGLLAGAALWGIKIMDVER